MNWLKVNLNAYQKVQNINPTKETFLYNIAPRPFTPVEKEDMGFDGEILSLKVEKLLNTYELSQLLQDLQKEFDKSDEVNCFILDDKKCWLDKDTRVGLVNSITVQQGAGLTETVLWFDGIAYRVGISYALNFLKALELYAIDCYNVTQSHLNEIKSISDRNMLFEYNISAGYPVPIVFDTEEIIEH